VLLQKEKIKCVVQIGLEICVMISEADAGMVGWIVVLVMNVVLARIFLVATVVILMVVADAVSEGVSG